MSMVEKAVEVQVPASTAYNQWTQFEDFPRFMEGVEEVKQLDDRHLHWRAEVGGVEREWDAEITEQIPDKRISWRSTGGPYTAGCVTFHRISDDTSRIMLQLQYEPESATEKVGDALGLLRRRVDRDLQCFKEFIEQRGRETGAWRGHIPSKDDVKH